MPAPILAGIGKMFTGVVAGTARGLAMGARATATTAKSSGKLVQSASNVKSNIIKSNKKIQKIKLNRKRIKKSIFSEQKRKLREQKIESRSRSNRKKGLLSSPLDAIGGVKKFIYTLLFGMAISNIQTIKKVFDKVVQGFINFGKLMMTIINATSFITGLSFNKDGEEFDSQVKDVENAFNIPGFDNTIKNIKDETKKNKKNLPSGQRKDKLNEAAKTVNIDRSNIGGKYLSVEEEITQERTKLQSWGEKNVPGISINLLPGGGYWKRIEFWQNLRELKKQSENEIRAKWEGGNPYINKNSLNNERIDIISDDSVNSENTIIINKTVIEKKYIPVN
jgi:hypothetical protein